MWTVERTQQFFCAVTAKKMSLASVIKAFAREWGMSESSLRNYYYCQLQLFRQMPMLASSIGVSMPSACRNTFTKFSAAENKTLLRTVMIEAGAGKSIRSILQVMSGGDSKEQLRLQNKYRSLLIHHSEIVEEIVSELTETGVEFYNPIAPAGNEVVDSLISKLKSFLPTIASSDVEMLNSILESK